MTKTCKVYRDLIENANEYHRDKYFPREQIVDAREQKELCCEQMKSILNDSVEFRLSDEPVLGVGWWNYDIFEIEKFKLCPFCGATIEYVQRKVFHYVEKMGPHWVLEEIQTTSKGEQDK